MRKLKALLFSLVVLCVFAIAGFVVATDQSPWLSTASPTLQKLLQWADSAPLAEKNIDCDRITTRLIGKSATREDCVVQTPLGLSSTNGIVFNGTSEMIPIVPYSPIFINVNSIPNQSKIYTYSSASTFGLYMHLYHDVRASIKHEPEMLNGQLVYKLSKLPDATISNLAGKAQPMNPGSLAFSENGDWMIFDFPFQGFVRVNLATLEMIPFAPSMNQGNDFASYTAQLTVSNDGRYAAIKPGNLNEFKVYDIASCSNAVLPVSPSSPKCQTRNYWPYINSQLSGLKALYQPRFTSDTQLYVTAQYEYSATGYKAAQFGLTAPGVAPTGIEYLGLGDSFASGQGAFNYMSGTDSDGKKCHLSSVSYPFLISAAKFNGGNSVACSGARMKDVIGRSQSYRGQNTPNLSIVELANLGLLNGIFSSFSPGYLLQKDFVDKYNPQNMTLSIGGNDIGFANIVKNCVMPKVINTTCYPTAEDQTEIANRIRSKENDLKNTYRQLSKPGRKLYVIGYPQIVVRGGNCANNVHLDESEIQMFTNLTDSLNHTIKKAADGAGAIYVDVSNAFYGHRMCETKSSNVAVNGFTAGNDDGLKKFKFIGAESYHPNALGHELLKQAILGRTNNFQSNQVSTQPGTGTLPILDAPLSGRPLNISIVDESLVPDVIAPLTTIPVTISGKTAQLKSNSPYNVRLDDSTTSIGTLTSDAGGVASGDIQIPGVVPCGLHTMHFVGQNIINQPLDITQEIYVTSDSGCANNSTICGPVSPAGIDMDKDGIDDACDPLITDPPKPAEYQAYLTGSSIHVTSASSATQSEMTNFAPEAPPAESGLAEVAVRGNMSRVHFVSLILLSIFFVISLKLYVARAAKA